MKLSVIVPTYNNGPELREAISSIFDQPELRIGGIDFEVILVDDASSPTFKSSLQELPKIFGDQVVCLHLPQNSGPAWARNEGIKKATGQWIGFLDADDLWPAGKVASLWQLALQGQSLVIGGQVQYFGQKPTDLSEHPGSNAGIRTHHVLLGALFVKKAVFDAGFWFDESLRLGEDTDWWMRIRESGLSIKLIDEITLFYRMHDGNMTKTEGNQNREMLALIHKSLQRRRSAENRVKPLPSIQSFAENSLAPSCAWIHFKNESMPTQAPSVLLHSESHHYTKSLQGALKKGRELHKIQFLIFCEGEKSYTGSRLLSLISNDPYLHWASADDESGSCREILLQSTVVILEELEKRPWLNLSTLRDHLKNKGFSGKSISRSLLQP